MVLGSRLPLGAKVRIKSALAVAGDAARLGSALAHLQPAEPRPLQVVVAWDVEPDDRLVDRRSPGPWSGYERMAPRIDAIRDRLTDVTGAPVAFSWLLRMDPQVEDTWGSPAFVADRYGGELTERASSADELGLHTHTWRWNDSDSAWVRDHDPVWEEHCADVALTTFESAFGAACRVHRGGDQVLSPVLLRRLEAAGVAVDITVEPDKPSRGPATRHERATGHTPDYRVAPLAPYRTSPAAFPARDPTVTSGPLLMPMACAPRGRRRPRKPLHLLLIPGLFATRLLRATHNGAQILVFAIRTDRRSLAYWDVLERNLDQLASRPGVRFVTVSSAASGVECLPSARGSGRVALADARRSEFVTVA